MIIPATAWNRRQCAAEVLGLEADAADAVRIILAAQLRLRRCRSGQAAGNRLANLEVRRIIAARDALLNHVVGRLTGPDAWAAPGSGTAGDSSSVPAGGRYVQ